MELVESRLARELPPEIRRNAIRTAYEEGNSDAIYDDSLGNKTSMIGAHIGDPNVASLLLRGGLDPAILKGTRKATIDDSVKAYKILYDNAQSDVRRLVGDDLFNSLDPVRQGVLTDMSFQMGVSKLGGFEKMIAALKSGDFTTASREIEDSNYYRSPITQKRATRNRDSMREGTSPNGPEGTPFNDLDDTHYRMRERAMQMLLPLDQRGKKQR